MESQLVTNGRHKKKRRKSSTHSLKEGKRSLSEGSKISPKKRDVTREPSTGSSVISLDVRCACQYYQCDSLLPDKISLVGTRPSSRLNTTTTRDHEYEPVNPPPDNETFLSSPPTVHIIDTDQEAKYIQPISETGIGVREIIIEHEEINKPESAGISVTPSTPATVSDGQDQEVDYSSTSEKNKEGPNKFQLALRQTTDQFKTKLHNIKRPHITMPDKSKFKLKIDKSKFSFPKIPDKAKNFPSFSLPRKHSENRSLKERQLSTESNDGDSKKPIIDFRTYPRFFKKKTKPTVDENDETISDFATIPRPSGKINHDFQSEANSKWKETDTVRIPLHSEDSLNAEYDEDLVETREELHQVDDNTEDSIEHRTASYNPHQKEDDDREDSVERRMASHIRYEEDIDTEDEYDRENVDINKDDYLNRWNFGSLNPDPNLDYFNNYKNTQYKVTDLDSPEDIQGQNDDFNSNNKGNYSSGSSLGMQRVGGVLEEIDSDEFFLRQKGISQDNIEVGMLLSSEIREAFRTPDNALSKIQDVYGREYNLRNSSPSLPESQPKRKAIKKPKRKKTPHTSQEQIPYAEESGDEDFDTLPPSRPKRRSKRVKKPKNVDDIIPYQETISLDINNPERLLHHRESLGILGDDERELDINITCENEMLEQKEQPETKITDSYRNFEFINMQKYHTNLNENDNFEEPAAPPRKQKSLRSLNLSENETFSDDIILNQNIFGTDTEKNSADTETTLPVAMEPPRRPSRMKSHTSSQSVMISQPEEDSLSRKTESLTSENQIPCVEEPCVQDIRDHMGYAIIDKQKMKDPPLPPPRMPPRRKRSIKSNKSLISDTKFFTVPRPTKDAPVRPLRNYSTLSQTQRNSDVATYENKENIDITQYIEMDEESNRDLQSGDVIKKMKDRPLPAPPRPPRKSRPLRDITSVENVISKEITPEESKLVLEAEETEVSTQTEPLPDDFVCEEVVQEFTDTILSPSPNVNNFVEKQDSSKPEENIFIEKRLIMPTYFTHEETITHGSLLVQPLNGSKILPTTELTSLSNERIVPITTESDGEETSSIPDDFRKLTDPVQDIKTTDPEQNINPEINILKTQKLQVSDLDVDKLTVNKLLAEKIIVSEIDTSNIQINEISSKSGVIKIDEIELPTGIIKQILKSITSNEDCLSKKEEAVSQKGNNTIDDISLQQEKKTSISDLTNINLPQQTSQTFSDSANELVEIDQYTDIKTVEEGLQSSKHPIDSFEINKDNQGEIPQPLSEVSDIENTEESAKNVVSTETSDKYQQCLLTQYEKTTYDSNSNNENIQEPEVDDVPPPRPPEPQLHYLSSQPPPSFYALRAQNYVETLGGNIPIVPRRRRQPKSKPISRSSSEESDITPSSRRFHNKSSEASITQLSGQLVRACGLATNNALKRLITYITNNVLNNADGKQDLHVMVIILLVLIAGLILLGYGDEKTVVHLHHWEYFNPPRDM